MFFNEICKKVNVNLMQFKIRFEMDQGNLRKIHDSIRCDKELKVKIKSKKLLVEGSYGKEQFEFKEDREATYKLISSINHIGSDFKTGHYVCHQFDNRLDGRLCFSDTIVSFRDSALKVGC